MAPFIAVINSKEGVTFAKQPEQIVSTCLISASVILPMNALDIPFLSSRNTHVFLVPVFPRSRP